MKGTFGVPVDPLVYLRNDVPLRGSTLQGVGFSVQVLEFRDFGLGTMVEGLGFLRYPLGKPNE